MSLHLLSRILNSENGSLKTSGKGVPAESIYGRRLPLPTNSAGPATYRPTVWT